MTILITGGGGFLGGRLAHEIQSLASLGPNGTALALVDKIVLADMAFGEGVRDGWGPMVTFAEGDIGVPAFADSMLSSNPSVIFHLAAMVSGDGERNFERCWNVNAEGTRHLLDACRKACPKTVVVFASSLAVFGGPYMPAIVSDNTKPFPQTTYGMTKLNTAS